MEGGQRLVLQADVGQMRALGDVDFGQGVQQIGALPDRNLHHGQARAFGQPDAVARVVISLSAGDADELNDAAVDPRRHVQCGAIDREHGVECHHRLAVRPGEGAEIRLLGEAGKSGGGHGG